MKTSILLAALVLERTLAFLSSEVHELYSNWKPAGPNDVRAPCPMLNTLANHGFLPHDGKDITEKPLVDTLKTHLNFNASFSQLLFNFALTTNPTPNATKFDLDHLSRHNILEHDGSLSRKDAYYGNNHVFDQHTYDQTRAYFTGPTIDVKVAADARLARMDTSNATNPTFALSDLGSDFSVGETAAYIMVFGDKVAGTVDTSLVNYFFENERLPTNLGWTKRTLEITFDDLENMSERLLNASASSFPYPIPYSPALGGLHTGRLG